MICTKRRFSLAEARRELEKIASEHYRARPECRMYYCRDCECWHLTSKSQIGYRLNFHDSDKSNRGKRRF